MALNPRKGADLFQTAIDQQIERQEAGEKILGPEEMAAELANAYLEYSKDATLPGADMTAGGDVSILETGFTVSDSSLTTLQMATAIAAYWSTFNVPGTPAHGGTVVLSVVVLGVPLAPAFSAAISSLITTSLVDDPYFVLFDTIEKVVNTIPCVITEQVGTTPTPFPEFIS